MFRVFPQPLFRLGVTLQKKLLYKQYYSKNYWWTTTTTNMWNFTIYLPLKKQHSQYGRHLNVLPSSHKLTHGLNITRLFWSWFQPGPRADASVRCIPRCGKLLSITAGEQLSVETTPFVLLKVSCDFIRVESTTRRFLSLSEWCKTAAFSNQWGDFFVLRYWNAALFSFPVATAVLCSPNLTW